MGEGDRGDGEQARGEAARPRATAARERLARIAVDAAAGGQTPPQDAKERARQMRFLMARGFSGAVVAKVLRMDPAEPDAFG